jgi:hypothetical protein
VTLLITIFVVIWHILVLIFERAPRVKIIEEIVEIVNFFFSALFIAKFGNRLDAGETTFSFEDIAPEFVKLITLSGLLGGGFNISMLINGIKLAALDGVK